MDIPPPLSAKEVGSFAYRTVKDRLPIILTRVIDLLYRDRNVFAKIHGEEVNAETKAVIGRLAKLRNEMETDKPIVILESNSEDVEIWNNFILKYNEDFGCEPSWFTSAWLIVECYLYRRIRQSFELSSRLSSFDPFREQKEHSFLHAIDVVSALSCYLLEMEIPSNSNNAIEKKNFIKEYFIRFIELSLWGNKCDLSLSSGEKVLPSDDPLQQLDSLRENILVNESESLYELLESQCQKSKKIKLHLVLDNAGFELFSDLCLVDFLFESGLVETAFIHVKEIPWFVSDTLEHDFTWLLNYLSTSENPHLKKLGAKWQDYHASNRWIIVKEKFWTLPYDYSQMEEVDSKLYEFLSQANLVIFKGDLNYRKLTGDLQWSHLTPFKTALRGFGPAPLCTLRTIKAEIVVGMKEENVKNVSSKHSNWMYSGEFALIQCDQ